MVKLLYGKDFDLKEFMKELGIQIPVEGCDPWVVLDTITKMCADAEQSYQLLPIWNGVQDNIELLSEQY